MGCHKLPYYQDIESLEEKAFYGKVRLEKNLKSQKITLNAYQYTLRDHLGNTRVSFGYMNQTDVFVATMESEKASEEEAEFTGIIRNGIVNHTEADHEASSPNTSAQLHGLGTAVGPSKYLSVSSGDKINMEVYAKYNPYAGANANILGSVLVSALTGTFNIANVGETQTTYQAFDGAAPGYAGTVSSSNGIPKAYISYILFNEDYTDSRFGYSSVSGQASLGFEKLTRDIEAPFDGHLYVYVVNETKTVGAEVSFDDMMIIHEQNSKSLQVVQSVDYYPFGLPITGTYYQNEGIVANRYLYQGKELRTEEDLDWYDFHARQYDPALGRFMAGDPQGQFGSPHNGMGNNPVMMVDPDGEFVFAALAIGAAIGAGTSAVVYTATALTSGNFSWGQLGKSVAFGAVSGAIGGGIGGAFANSTFAQTAGFSLLNNTASTLAGTAIMGGDITAGTIAGGIVGGLVSAGLPQFTGVNGGALANVGAELAHEAIKGGVSGTVSGGISAAVDGTDIGNGIAQGALNGAVGAATMSSLKILALGHTVKLDQKELDLIYNELGTDFSNYPSPVFRKGRFFGAGITVGRNISHHMVDDEYPMQGPKGGRGGRAYTYSGFAHELKHYQQISQNGIGRFYARLFGQYLRYGYRNSQFEADAYKFGSRMNNIFRGMYQGR